MKTELPGCARCPFVAQDRLCQKENGKSPSFCPTQNDKDIIDQALEELKKPDILEFAKQASIQEGERYTNRKLDYQQVKPIKPRILETIEFAHRMKYKRLGFVFCIGLIKEAKVVEKLLSSEGFEVVSALCKLGREPKETLGVRDDHQGLQRAVFVLHRPPHAGARAPSTCARDHRGSRVFGRRGHAGGDAPWTDGQPLR